MERHEVAKHTIFRDLDTLNKSGIPIVTHSVLVGEYQLLNDTKNIFIALFGLMSVNKNNEFFLTDNIEAKFLKVTHG